MDDAEMLDWIDSLEDFDLGRVEAEDGTLLWEAEADSLYVGHGARVRDAIAECRVRMGRAGGADMLDGRDDHPRDPSDLGRCLGLLAAVPELAAHLPAMADASPEWAALVAAWGELEALYREELPSGKAPRCYRRMEQILMAAKAAELAKGGPDA